MTVTTDICDHPFFKRLAASRVQYYHGTYYEMENGSYTEDIRQARVFKEGNANPYYKCIYESKYRVGDREFSDTEPGAYEKAIEYSMVLLILTYGFRNFRQDKG